MNRPERKRAYPVCATDQTLSDELGVFSCLEYGLYGIQAVLANLPSDLNDSRTDSRIGETAGPTAEQHGMLKRLYGFRLGSGSRWRGETCLAPTLRAQRIAPLHRQPPRRTWRHTATAGCYRV
jgi:hypothetical protein